MSFYTQSSQHFVRALKSVSDPPEPGGPEKIDIVRVVWDNVSFSIPNKGEVILDWILSRLLQDKSRDLKASAVGDIRFWRLLNDIIESETLSNASRPIRVWLIPLINRTPLAPIALTFLTHMKSIDIGIARTLSSTFKSCLTVLWPLGVSKMTPDLLLDCFSAVLSIVDVCKLDENLAHVCSMIVSSYLIAFDNSSVKKKVYASFAESHLTEWLGCMAQVADGETLSPLLENIYTSGIDTLFNLDTLRQAQDTSSEDRIFGFLREFIPSSSCHIVAILPRLFSSYVQRIYKYRNALYAQDSSQTSEHSLRQTKASGMKFFRSCNDILRAIGEDERSWSARAAIVSVVESERLFTSTQQETQKSILENIEMAIGALDEARKVERLPITGYAIHVLTTLARIDYEMIESSMTNLLPELLVVPQCCVDVLALLDLSLDYYVKTRTMDDYTLKVLHVLSQCHLSHSGEPQTFHTLALTSPVFSRHHLEHYSRSVQNFITPGQVIRTMHEVEGILQSTWGRVQSYRGPAENQISNIVSDDASVFSVAFSLVARFSSVFLTAVMKKSLPDTIKRDARLLVGQMQTFSRQVSHASLVPREVVNNGPHQLVAAASLRFAYSLNRGATFHSGDEKLRSAMFTLVKNHTTLPELLLETFRLLLADPTTWDGSDNNHVLNSALAYLEEEFRPKHAELRLVTGNRQSPALNILHLLVRRWVSNLDLLSSTQILERLVRLLQDVRTAPQAQVCGVINELFCSAQFWELPVFRATILQMVDEKTSILDGISLEAAIALNDLDSSGVGMEQLEGATAAYEVLLNAPMEYCTRPHRTQFIERAVIADVLTNLIINHLDDVSRAKHKHFLITARTFLQRAYQQHNVLDHTATLQYLRYLFWSPAASGLSDDHLSITTDLVELCLRTILHSSGGNLSDSTATVVEWFIEWEPFKHFPDDTRGNRLVELSLVRFIRMLKDEFVVSAFSEHSKATMKQLCKKLTITLATQLVGSNGTHSKTTTYLSDMIAAWSNNLAFGAWLGLDQSSIPHLGHKLAAALIRDGQDISLLESYSGDVYSETITLLFEELRWLSNLNRSIQLGVTLTIYLLLGVQIPIDFDACIVNSCKEISVQDFSHLLEIIHTEMSLLSRVSLDCAALLRLSALLIHEAPPGTSQTLQAFMTRCLNLFANNSKTYIQTPELCCSTLKVIDEYCTEKPVSIRSSDLSTIFTFLSHVIAGSSEQHAITSPTIFHYIITILTVLIRLRRDIIMNNLPHLGLLLRALIKTTRALRPRLGAKQARVVTDTFPPWIHPIHPLSCNEGRALARLLTTLTTKTVPSTHMSQNATETQKAESLSKPFARHAIYILLAYVEILNDPLCVLSVDMRKELEPGIFALCEMVGEHSRDSVMVSVLDAGGKTIMKEIWKQFEKQKYIGKG